MLSFCKYLIIGLALTLCTGLFAQFSTSIGVEGSLLNTKEDYVYGVSVFNENETMDFYVVNSDLGVTTQGLVLRSFGGQFMKNSGVTCGYSLGIGYRHFSSASEFTYVGSSTDDKDSIVNEYDNFQHKTQYHIIRFTNFFDVHWNYSETLKITNSIGIGFNAIVQAKSANLEFDGSIVNANHPILKLIYQPQITKAYKRFSMTYFASIGLFAVPLFTKPNPFDIPDERIPFEKLRINTIGIGFIPYFKKEEKDPHSY